ncbi:LOW QUALITY PROTEIN: polyadenylate-binding protein-interacting protein 1 [Manacus vitellinus]|uniref:LOW QUALITY PROTEIN: polyadenylate-binding protein-interacting protein 1 n=1 Tax=Manacus vitellinus TaxID=328815 RepID=UPI00115CDE55|nr:LOW QUALITY PROTEIN: polyadenylate-binding protein-interacting protein 1 [Manacus vitellinus]
MSESFESGAPVPAAARARGGGAPERDGSGGALPRAAAARGSGRPKEHQHFQAAASSRSKEPLRPPKTAPLGTGMAEHLQKTGFPSGSEDKASVLDSGPEMTEPQLAVASVVTSKLSVKAPEFYPPGYNQNFNQNFTDSSFEDRYDGYLTLAEYVQDFLNHLTEQPGCFETEIEHFAEALNGWVTTDEALQELVELIYQQATSVPNFSYMGARLCNYLSHHLTISPQSGNFRQLLLQRCRTEYENRNEATKGDEATKKQFHSFVLFLAELYLNLEIKGTRGQVTRAEILQEGLRELLNALFSNPVDSNLICAVKLLKLTGSVLEDAWKEKGKSDMEEVIQRIENVVLDASCSRDVKHKLLKLVELRSSNWGRVHGTTSHTEATPENDPNYFMNEPTFYTSDGVPFTAADPDYQEEYQELLEREDLFPYYEENGADLLGPGDMYFDEIDDEMDPEIEEAYEKFCLESEHERKQ